MSDYRSQKRELSRALREKEEEIGKLEVFSDNVNWCNIISIEEIVSKMDSLRKTARENDREKRTVSIL